MIERLCELIAEKQFSLTSGDLRHHLESLPNRKQLQLLTELLARVALIQKLDLKSHLVQVIKQTKTHYKHLESTVSTESEVESDSKYDVLFNLSHKVLFETALAGAVMENKKIFAASVNKVASQIAEILSQTLFNEDVMRGIPKSEFVLNKLLKHINSMDCCDFYNRHKQREQRTPIPKKELPEFMTWALRALRDPEDNNLDEKMFLIYIYTGFISRPDRMGCETVSEAPDALYLTKENKAVVIDLLKKHKYAGIPGAFNAKGRSFSRRARKSIGETTLLSTEEANPPHNIAGIVPGQGVRGAKPIDLSALPSELVRLLTLADPHYNRSSSGIFQPCYVKEEGKPRTTEHFFDEAFYKHNLPLVGSASGGAGTYEMAIALTPGLAEEDIRKIRVLNMAMYISYGFHSLHEVCYIQMLCGSDYKVGDYKSVMYPDLMGEKNYTLLRKEFAHLLNLPYQGSQIFKGKALKKIRRTSSLPLKLEWSPTHFRKEKVCPLMTPTAEMKKSSPPTPVL